MRKKIVLTLGSLLVLTVILMIFPVTRDEIDWRLASFHDTAESYSAYIKAWPNGRHIADARDMYDERTWSEALKLNSVSSYEDYLQLHPQGKYVAQALDKIETLRWQEATTSNTVDAYRQYLQLYPEGKYATEALDKIELLDWQEATTSHTIRAYNQYLLAYPKGKYVDEANKRIRTLRYDKSIYQAVIRECTEDALVNFLRDFPGHIMQSQAKKVLREITEGRDIVDLINENKIEVQAYGKSIEQVSVRIRKRVSYRLTVRIPVGTYFVSANPSSQNMVTTAEVKVQLTSSEWRTVEVEVACANISRDIPNKDDRFTILRSPYQEELAKVVRAFEKEQVPYAVRQAVVWIITDDANYKALGTLVISPYGFYGGERQIKEEEAALALKIIDEAGIDIRQKSIWWDVPTILRGLENPELREWLNKKMASDF